MCACVERERERKGEGERGGGGERESEREGGGERGREGGGREYIMIINGSDFYFMIIAPYIFKISLIYYIHVYRSC